MNQRGTWRQMLLHYGFTINYVDGLVLQSFSHRPLCVVNHDYRCGVGGMEIKIEQKTAVNRECATKMSLLSHCRHRNMPEGFVFLCTNKSEAAQTHVVA